MNKLMTIILFFIFSLASSAKLEVISTEFTMKTLRDLESVESEIHKIGEDNMEWSDIDFTPRYLISGTLKITRLDKETFERETRVIEGVNLLYKFNGLYLKPLLEFNGNKKISIYGLEGNTLNDLFNSTFNGGRYGLGLAFVAKVNPNVSFAKNEYGMTIMDTSKWINGAINPGKASYGLAIEAGHHSFAFTRDSAPIRRVIKSGEEIIDEEVVEHADIEAMLEEVL